MVVLWSNYQLHNWLCYKLFLTVSLSGCQILRLRVATSVLIYLLLNVVHLMMYYVISHVILVKVLLLIRTRGKYLKLMGLNLTMWWELAANRYRYRPIKTLIINVQIFVQDYLPTKWNLFKRFQPLKILNCNKFTKPYNCFDFNFVLLNHF